MTFFDEDMKYYDPDAYFNGGYDLEAPFEDYEESEGADSEHSSCQDGIPSTYQGEFNAEGERHGEGQWEEMNWQDDKCVYKGEFENGRPHGTGVKTVKKNGHVTTGEFQRGFPHGSAIVTRPEHSEEPWYEGEFVKGKYHGTGALQFHSEKGGRGGLSDSLNHLVGNTGTGHYLGDFVEGQFHGEGIMTWEGSEAGPFKYEGEWRNGLRHGDCHFFSHKDVKKYVGQYESDARHGFGTCTTIDGIHYRGEWMFGLWNGEGKCQCSCGTVREGKWHLGEFLEDSQGSTSTPIAPTLKKSFCPPGGTYTGERSNDGKRHGRGVYVVADSTYDGQWNNDEFHGQGTLTTKTGEVIVGKFARGAMHGHFTVNSPSNEYAGEMSNFLKHGKGRFVSKGSNEDKFTYEGEWRDNHFHGCGIVVDAEGTYEGEFREHRRHGRGKFRRADPEASSLYEGEFKEGVEDGQGEMRMTMHVAGSPVNSHYVGEFSEGKMHGQGVQKTDTPAYNVCNTGEFQNGKLHGSAEVVLIESGPNAKQTKKGTFVEGTMVHGRYEDFSTGFVYQGEWSKSKITAQAEQHGRGEAKYASGTRYEGLWRHGKREGQGVLYQRDGTVIAGHFTNGELDQKCPYKLSRASATLPTPSSNEQTQASARENPNAATKPRTPAPSAQVQQNPPPPLPAKATCILLLVIFLAWLLK